MAETVSFILDTRDVDRELASLGKQVPRIVARSLNRTNKGFQTVMKRPVARDVGVKVGTISKLMKTGKASPGRPRATTTVRDKRIPLIQLAARQTRRGVTYRSGGKRRRIPHGFIATMPTGHEGVFVRRRRARLPIRELFAASILKVFRRHLPKGRARVAAQLPKEIRAGIKQALRAA